MYSECRPNTTPIDHRSRVGASFSRSGTEGRGCGFPKEKMQKRIYEKYMTSIMIQLHINVQVLHGKFKLTVIASEVRA